MNISQSQPASYIASYIHYTAIAEFFDYLQSSAHEFSRIFYVWKNINRKSEDGWGFSVFTDRDNCGGWPGRKSLI